MPEGFNFGESIQQPSLTKPDIRRIVYDVMNNFEGGTINGGTIKDNTKILNAQFGLSAITVEVGENIQNALDYLNSIGGGILYLGSGTYKVNTTLNWYSSTQIIGENTSTTIIDFNSSAGILKAAGTNVYTTGTITSIASGVNVTGSGTAWLANASTDHQFFLAGRWYKIAAVLTDTTLTLAEGYDGSASFPGAAYRIAKVVKDIEIKDVTLKSSTGNSIDLDDVRNIFIEDAELNGSATGVTMDNVSEIDIKASISVSHTSNGAVFTNCAFLNANGFSTASCAGHGVVLNTVRDSAWFACSSDSNTSSGDGFNITSCDNILLVVLARSNAGQGIELVSGNTDIKMIDCGIKGNTSDGIKLTASSDNCHMDNCAITGNGGYGINVAVSGDDNNLIIGNYFASNTSGNVNNSGTGTLIRGNIGVTDNSTSALLVTYKNGVTTRAGNTASGAQTIAHGLGATPSKVKITCTKTIGSENIAGSEGAYNGTTTSCVYWETDSAASTAATDSTNVAHIADDGAETKLQVATIAVDGTNITLTWTKTGTPSNNNINIMWEVE